MRTGASFLSLALLAVAAFAKDPAFVAPPSGFRMGMEIELVPEAFANLTGYFDFKRLQLEQGRSIAKDLPDDFFDDYLRNSPDALSTLPKPLRETLTKGLELQSTVIHNAQALDPSILDARGKDLSSQPRIILPNSLPPANPVANPQLIFPFATPTVTHRLELQSQSEAQRPAPAHAESAGPVISTQAVQKQGDLLVPKHASWQKLYERWNALDPDVKRSSVQWENLSPRKKAIIAVLHANGVIHVKEDLPPEEKRLFERLEWDRDLGAIEFRHRADLQVTDPAEFFRDVRLLAQRAGVERKILRPDEFYQNRQNLGARAGLSQGRLKMLAGLHVHVSVKDRDLTEIAKAFNKLALIRRINLGILDDLMGTRLFNYTHDPRSKGLVRLYSNDRIEFRDHRIPLEDELGFILKVLNMDPKEAVDAIDAETKKLMTNEVVDRIAEYRLNEFSDYEKYMRPEQRSRKQPWIDVRHYVDQISKSQTLPGDFWSRAHSLLASKDSYVRKRALEALKTHSSWPKEFWEHVPQLMRSDGYGVRMAVFSALEGQAAWPKAVWDVFPELMASDDPNLKNQISYLIKGREIQAQSVGHCVVNILSTLRAR